MEIRDEDMQMVRDALATAPEYVKGHFENLLTQYEAVAARLEELKNVESELDRVTGELAKFDEQLAIAECEFEDDTKDKDDALEAVRYWMWDRMYYGKPLGDPRPILQQVEDALR